MAIWDLKPQNFDHRNWTTSRFKDRVVIRADHEERARDIATMAFCSATERDIHKDMPFNPWSNEQLVVCERIINREDDEGGPEAILEPSEYDHEWRR